MVSVMLFWQNIASPVTTLPVRSMRPNSANFHAFAARGGVIEHLVHRMRKGRQAMLGVAVLILAAAQRLAVDRDMVRRRRGGFVAHDGAAEQFGEDIGIDGAHRLGQRRMARHFVAPEPQLHARFQR